MSPTRSRTLPLLALFVFGGGASAQATSFEGAAFLTLPVGAQGVSLGLAMTAMPGQESAFWNPAGLATTRGSKLVLLRGESVVGTSTGISAILVRRGRGTLGLSYLLWDAGDVEERDGSNTLLGTVTLRNHAAVMSAAVPLVRGLNVGANFKLVQFRLSCRGNCSHSGTASTTYAMDAGIQMMPSATIPLRLGAMVAHFGPRFQHENAEQADPLPTRIRLAAAYDVLHALARVPELEGWLTVEVQERVRHPRSVALYVGSEVVAGRTDRLFLRAGYVALDADQPGGASVGLGVQVQDFELSLAKSLAGTSLAGETDPFTVALSFGF